MRKSRMAAVFLAALPSILLPLYILVFATPISDPDVLRLAQLHLRPDFWPRVVLTFLYFPAVIALHFFIRPLNNQWAATLFLAGFAMFAAGNGIDALWRSVQYLTVHGLWAGQVLGGDAAGLAAKTKIETFSELAPAVTASFSLLFGSGRVLMGWALILGSGRLVRLAGLALVVNGLWNLLSVAAQAALLSFLSTLGGFYLWPWLASLLLVSVAALMRDRPGGKQDWNAAPCPTG